jgi:hypothetical protein
MRPVVRTTTFRRDSKDMDRIVKLFTMLHGRLYQPPRRRERLALPRRAKKLQPGVPR